MVSQLAMAGGVEDQESGLVARRGIVFGAEAVCMRFEVGGQLAEGCLRRLAGVRYGGLAIGELRVQGLEIVDSLKDAIGLTEVKSVVFPPPLGPSRRMVGSCLGTEVR